MANLRILLPLFVCGLLIFLASMRNMINSKVAVVLMVVWVVIIRRVAAPSADAMAAHIRARDDQQAVAQGTQRERPRDS